MSMAYNQFFAPSYTTVIHPYFVECTLAIGSNYRLQTSPSLTSVQFETLSIEYLTVTMTLYWPFG